MAFQLDSASMKALQETMRGLVNSLEERVAAGDLTAIPPLSELHRHGALGVPVNHQKAYELVKNGKEKGDLICMILYHTFNLTDDPLFAKKKEEALLFLDHHRKNQYALAYLGDYYLRKGEDAMGLPMLLQAAENGIPFALHEYGMHYVNHRKMPHKFIYGMSFLVKAVAQGHIASVAEYGRILCEEEGHLSDRIGGLQMLQLAIEAGCSRAADYFRPVHTHFM